MAAAGLQLARQAKLGLKTCVPHWLAHAQHQGCGSVVGTAGRGWYWLGRTGTIGCGVGAQTVPCSCEIEK